MDMYCTCLVIILAFRMCLSDSFSTRNKREDINNVLKTIFGLNDVLQPFFNDHDLTGNQLNFKYCNPPKLNYLTTLQPKQSFYFENAIVRILCMEGFKTEDETILQCLADDTWSHKVPNCLPNENESNQCIVTKILAISFGVAFGLAICASIAISVIKRRRHNTESIEDVQQKADVNTSPGQPDTKEDRTSQFYLKDTYTKHGEPDNDKSRYSILHVNNAYTSHEKPGEDEGLYSELQMYDDTA